MRLVTREYCGVMAYDYFSFHGQFGETLLCEVGTSVRKMPDLEIY